MEPYYIEENSLVEELKNRVKLSSNKQVAKELGLSEQYVSDICTKRRGISNSVAETLGYKSVTLFIKIK